MVSDPHILVFLSSLSPSSVLIIKHLSARSLYQNRGRKSSSEIQVGNPGGKSSSEIQVDFRSTLGSSILQVRFRPENGAKKWTKSGPILPFPRHGLKKWTRTTFPQDWPKKCDRDRKLLKETIANLTPYFFSGRPVGQSLDGSILSWPGDRSASHRSSSSISPTEDSRIVDCVLGDVVELPQVLDVVGLPNMAKSDARIELCEGPKRFGTETQRHRPSMQNGCRQTTSPLMRKTSHLLHMCHKTFSARMDHVCTQTTHLHYCNQCETCAHMQHICRRATHANTYENMSYNVINEWRLM